MLVDSAKVIYEPVATPICAKSQVRTPNHVYLLARFAPTSKLASTGRKLRRHCFSVPSYVKALTHCLPGAVSQGMGSNFYSIAQISGQTAAPTLLCNKRASLLLWYRVVITSVINDHRSVVIYHLRHRHHQWHPSGTDADILPSSEGLTAQQKLLRKRGAQNLVTFHATCTCTGRNSRHQPHNRIVFQ